MLYVRWFLRWPRARGFLAPARADAVGVAFCFLVHGKAGDDVEFRTTVKYALVERPSRTEASEAARAEGERTLQNDYAHLTGQSVYEHGEAIAGPYCDTWAFTSGYWTPHPDGVLQLVVLVPHDRRWRGDHRGCGAGQCDQEPRFAQLVLGTRRSRLPGVDTGDSGSGNGDLAIGEVDPP